MVHGVGRSWASTEYSSERERALRSRKGLSGLSRRNELDNENPCGTMEAYSTASQSQPSNYFFRTNQSIINVRVFKIRAC